eukprot:2536466-Lingulodinium_polyedra.AAC.1
MPVTPRASACSSWGRCLDVLLWVMVHGVTYKPIAEATRGRLNELHSLATCAWAGAGRGIVEHKELICA